MRAAPVLAGGAAHLLAKRPKSERLVLMAVGVDAATLVVGAPYLEAHAAAIFRALSRGRGFFLVRLGDDAAAEFSELRSLAAAFFAQPEDAKRVIGAAVDSSGRGWRGRRLP